MKHLVHKLACGANKSFENRELKWEEQETVTATTRETNALKRLLERWRLHHVEWNQLELFKQLFKFL